MGVYEKEVGMFKRLRMDWALQVQDPCIRYEKAARAAFMQQLPDSAALRSLRRCCWAMDSAGTSAYIVPDFEKLIDITPEPIRRWYGVDFDGTLSTYNYGQGTGTGDPIPQTVAAVKALLKQGEVVKVMTARVSPSSLDMFNENREAVVKVIEDWCKKHIGCVLPVTNEKDFGMTSLRDDRAVQVVPNQGIRVDGVADTETEPGSLLLRAEDSIAWLTGHVIRFNSGIEDLAASDYDAGMLARVYAVERMDADAFKLHTDFSEFEVRNKAFMKPTYWEHLGVGGTVMASKPEACLKWCDTILYPKDKKCDDYISYGRMPFDVVTGQV